MGIFDSLRRLIGTLHGRDEAMTQSDKPRDTELMRRRQREASEQILENSSLRDALDDQQANVLLDWGLRKIKDAAQGTADLPHEAAESVMQSQTEAVSGVMRQVNEMMQELAAGRQEGVSQRLAQLLDDLDAFRSESADSTIQARTGQVLNGLNELEPDQRFDRIMKLVKGDLDQADTGQEQT